MLTVLPVLPDKHLKLLNQKLCEHSSLLDRSSIDVQILKLGIFIFDIKIIKIGQFESNFLWQIGPAERRS